ncbi:MAG: hypothetical protein DRQ14_09065 [Candidatus Latescibacterota bacterium]|nr:MAG: hypothetical protein DRQ14_09065 [Candidatus Latescibacterota bacterium]
MRWVRSFDQYGREELVGGAGRVVAYVETERGHMRGFVCGMARDVFVGSACWYDDYGMCKPERAVELKRKVEAAL